VTGGSRVLLTGAAGLIATALRDRLPPLGWDVRSFDRVPVDGGLVGDLANPTDLDAAVTGVDAIAHFAGQPTEAPWPVVRDANIDGLVNLFEAARRHDVRRVVFASSNHATGFTPVPTDGTEVPADVAPRPDTLYGVSKAFGEALGRYYVDRYGFEVACLRIGTCQPRPGDRRGLSTWLSFDDCARLVDATLRAPSLTFAVVWGVSANTRRTWSLDAGRALGYEPVDDAEQFAADLDAAPELASDDYVGGAFTTAEFGQDEVGRW
jgi:uronate dehydrogenase